MLGYKRYWSHIDTSKTPAEFVTSAIPGQQGPPKEHPTPPGVILAGDTIVLARNSHLETKAVAHGWEQTEHNCRNEAVKETDL